MPLYGCQVSLECFLQKTGLCTAHVSTVLTAVLLSLHPISCWVWLKLHWCRWAKNKTPAVHLPLSSTRKLPLRAPCVPQVACGQ